MNAAATSSPSDPRPCSCEIAARRLSQDVLDFGDTPERRRASHGEARR